MPDFPTVQSYKNIQKLFDAIQRAEVPSKFTYETLKKLGLTSSTDRGLVSLLKKLGFLGPAGEPLEPYRDMKGAKGWKPILGRQLKEAYRDLYAIDPEIHRRDKNEIAGAIARLTGKGQSSVDMMTYLFQSLAKHADFDQPTEPVPTSSAEIQNGLTPDGGIAAHIGVGGFYYNIQIHLPAVRDISVYNAIFKSLREQLLQ